MKRIIRVFPRRTSLTPDDGMAFVGDPPFELWRSDADEVHVSVTFTWDIEEGNRLAAAWGEYYDKVLVGGPVFEDHCYPRPYAEFVPNMYVKQGVTFTTRGCNNNCPWCMVPFREGKLVEDRDFAPGNRVQDNNLLQASRGHIRRVFEMLSVQRRAAVFSGGLDARLMDDWFVEHLKGIRVDTLFMAADTVGALRPLERALGLLKDLGRRKKRVYVLLGYDGESIDQALERLEAVWNMGGMPFAQLYQPRDVMIQYPKKWKRLARTWSRPAAMITMHKGGK